MENKRTKVLHIADKFGVKGSSVHGVSRLFSWWFPRFDIDRFDVRLIGLRKEDEACRNLIKQGIKITSLNRNKFDFLTIIDIVRIAKAFEADILHLHGYGSTNFGRIAAKIINKKSIVHEHFVDPNLPLYQIPFDFMLSRSTNYGIAVSDSVNEFMVKKRFLPKHQVQTIFNGAPLDLYQPREEEIVRRERKAWGIPREHKIVATIGRIDEQKGNKYLIDAAVELLKRGYKITFMVIGDGPLLNELRDRCQKRQIYKHFVFTGYQKNIPLIQSIIDIQVFPSLWEGTPLTLFEAMSMGKAIVSTTVDGLGEVLTHDVNALLVAPRTTHELCQAIERLYLDSKLSQALAHKARMDSAQFDIQTSVDKMQHIYEQLITKS